MAGSEGLKISKSPIRPQSTGRREQIIDAALKVMISNGVYNATTRKIAEAAGVNVATLHYHFHNKEEIIFSAIEELASRYRNTLSVRFQKPQNIHDRIHDLLWFIWGEIEQAPGEQLALQEMTLYMLRVSHAGHLAAQKEREIKSLYSVSLRRCSDVGASDEPQIEELTDFIYACFVGILKSMAGDQGPVVTRKNDRQSDRGSAGPGPQTASSWQALTSAVCMLATGHHPVASGDGHRCCFGHGWIAETSPIPGRPRRPVT